MMSLLKSSAAVLLLLIALHVRFSVQVDRTMVAREKGHDVVLKVIGKLDSSNVFSQQDNNLLHRIAWQMTHDGNYPNTYRNGYHGGIWQIDEANLLETKNVTAYPKLAALYDRLWDTFGIKWLQTRWIDLEIPFYSGIAARLYIETFPEAIPQTIEEQAKYWFKYYITKEEKGTAKQFIQENIPHEKDYRCVAKRDLCFILDSSDSVTVPNHNKALNFLWDVASSMALGDAQTHVSMVTYSTDPVLSFADIYNNATLYREIMRVPYIGKWTYTGKAMDFAFDNIATPYFRKNQSAILPVFVLLTDGGSQDDVKPASQRLVDNGITAIAVGIGNDIRMKELRTIANYKPQNVLLVSAFDVLEAILKLLQDSTCSTPAQFIIDDEAVEFDLGATQSTFVRVALPSSGATVKVNVVQGDVTAYVSYSEHEMNVGCRGHVRIKKKVVLI